MFTKTQTEELNYLSLLTYGTKSRWKKLLEDGHLNVPTGITKNNSTTYFQIPHAKGPNGVTPKPTVITAETALRKGLVTQEEVEKNSNNQKLVTRRPEFDEIKQTLNDVLRVKSISSMMENEKAAVAAYEYQTGKLPGKFNLNTPENMADYEELVARVTNESHKEAIKTSTLKEGDKQTAMLFDVYQFLTSYLEAQDEPEKALSNYNESFANAKTMFEYDLKARRII